MLRLVVPLQRLVEAGLNGIKASPLAGQGIHLRSTGGELLLQLQLVVLVCLELSLERLLVTLRQPRPEARQEGWV